MEKIDRQVSVVINGERCIGCGTCIAVCPSGTLALEAGQAIVSGHESLSCGHCEAACPVEAIRIGALNNDSQQFATFRQQTDWLAPGSADIASLVQLMRSRRSCRNYQDRPVPLAVLQDLVKIGLTAPSGSNCQPWAFTLLPSRAAVLHLGDMIGAFFRRLNRMADRYLLRGALRMIGRPELDFYFRNYRNAVAEALEAWDRTGRDLLFHGAPAVILVGTRADAACPKEDALLATQNMLLGAHAMGLGTCLIGFAVSALKQDPAILKRLDIPDGESVHAVIALGYPDEKEIYQRLPGRKALTQRVWDPDRSD
ncbi:MAG: nitroreductase family protein [Desulfobacterales bacterium]|nr:nitroreductase family protein [Desulfobacterales bacterium]